MEEFIATSRNAKIIESHFKKRHFKKRFKKETKKRTEKLTTPPKSFSKVKTAEEMTKAVQQSANNKAPGKYNINVELIKHAPREAHREISNV